MTISEDLFEHFCHELRIPVRRVEEGKDRQPDFVIKPRWHTVVVEIKQFDPTPEERELIDRFMAGECVIVDASSTAPVFPWTPIWGQSPERCQ